MASSYFLENESTNFTREVEDDIFGSLENLSPLHNGFPELMLEQHQTESTSKNQEVSLEKANHLPDQAQNHIAENSKVVYWANPSRGNISWEAITNCFHLPSKQAAQVLEIGLCRLRKRCRELGISRWPHRKFKSIDIAINNFQELSNNPGNLDREKLRNAIPLLESRRQLLQYVPNFPLEHETKRLEKVLHSANYKRRKKNRISESSSSAVEGKPSLRCPIDPPDQE